MSRIGKKPIAVPSGVKVTISAERLVHVEGPKGKLNFQLPGDLQAKVADQQVVLTCDTEDNQERALFGLSRTLVANMVLGVTQGFQKGLEIEGLGYKAQVQGKIVNLQFGYSHMIPFPIPDGITIEAPKPTQIVVKGIDKQLVGQVAADIRALCPPEPYKGKGVKYVGEIIRRKVGKAAATK